MIVCQELRRLFAGRPMSKLLTVQPQRNISGCVINDLNGNGTVNGGEVASPGYRHAIP